MTALRITLNTSSGQEVSLRAGREMSWPDGARMDWVRRPYGEPALDTGTLAFVWNAREDGGVEVECRIEDSTPWEGFRVEDPVDQFILSACEDDFAEWADTFCIEVNKALADTPTLTPFADLHWHETEAARVHGSLDPYVRDRTGFNFADGLRQSTDAERALTLHVRHVIVEGAERKFQRDAAAQFEAEGGRREEGTDREAGLNCRSVPNDVLKAARKEMEQ